MDLLTKAMPWSRIRGMLLLWGFDIRQEAAGRAHVPVANARPWQHNHNNNNNNNNSSRSSNTTGGTAATRVLALLTLMSCVSRGVSTGMELWSEPQPLRVDPTLMSWAFLMAVMILLIIGWECLRWAGLRTIEQYGPGSTKRRQRRLLRLREQTAAMIEAELRQRSVQQDKFPQRHGREGGQGQQFHVTKDNGTTCLQGHSPRAAAVLRLLSLSER